MATQEKVDVVIVGAGPSGAIFADVLARAGKKVVVLEFGPDWDMKQFVSSEIWAQAPQARAALRARRPATVPATARTRAGAPAARCCTSTRTGRACIRTISG